MAGIDSFTKLMLHLDGVDGSTVITDSSISPHTVTAIANAQIDTAQSKFDGASGLFDGTDDELTIPDHADWAFGTDKFTIDCWIRPNASDDNVICGQVDNSTNFWGFVYNSNTNKIQFGSITGNVWDVNFSIPATLNTGTWYHVAVVRDGTTAGAWHMFLGGVEGSKTLATGAYNGTIFNGTGNLRIGSLDGNLAGDIDGWIDEFRISKGVARWTSGFTSPTEAYSVESITADADFNLPLLDVQAAGAAGAELTLPAFSVVAATGIGAELTLPAFSVVANDVPPSTATITFLLLSVSSQGSTPANASNTFPSLIISADSQVRGIGQISLPLNVDATGLQGHVESATISLPAFTLNIRSGLTPTISLPKFVIAAEGNNGYVGILGKGLPRLIVNVKATQGEIVTSINSLPQFNFNLTGLQGIVSSSVSNRTLPMLDVNAHAYKGNNGNTDIILPILVLVTEVALNPNANLSQTLLMLTLDAYADVYTNRII